MSTARGPRLRLVTVGVGAAVFLGTAVCVATSPVSVAVQAWIHDSPGASPPWVTVGGRRGAPCVRQSAQERLADHAVSRQEPGDSASDGLGTLNLQEMAHSVDRALLEV